MSIIYKEPVRDIGRDGLIGLCCICLKPAGAASQIVFGSLRHFTCAPKLKAKPQTISPIKVMELVWVQ